jgi:DNA-directed RNA polymerase specialized sigma24 family protein
VKVVPRVFKNHAHHAVGTRQVLIEQIRPFLHLSPRVADRLYRVVSLRREIFRKCVRNRSQVRSVFAASALIGEMLDWLRQQFGRERGHARNTARAAERHRLHALRLRRLFDDTHDGVWRTLRRLGVPAPRLEESFQQVYRVVAERLNELESGQERAFAYRTALRCARVAAQRDARTPFDESDEHAPRDLGADPSFDRERLLELCDEVLAGLAPSLREVFVLHELEGLPEGELAALLEIPCDVLSVRLLCAGLCVRDQIVAIGERNARSELRSG